MQVSCPIAQQCGGCSCIGVPYHQQLSTKQSQVDALFSSLVSSERCLLPIKGMERPLRYRNKIVSPFAPAAHTSGLAGMRNAMRTGRAGATAQRRECIQTGLYAAGTHRLIACSDCPVEHQSGRRIVEAVRTIMARYGMEPFNEDAGTGFVRHVVVRVGHASGEVLVTLVTNGRAFTGAKNFCRELLKRCPEITTIVQNVNTRSTNAIFGDEEQVLYGPGFILDTLCGLSFRISSRSFYQVNAVQTEVLYAAALASGGLAGAVASSGTQSARKITVLDAYCGTGTIGLVAAAATPGSQIIGVDKVASAIEDARQNAAHNGIENARFIAEDAGFFMREYAAAGNAVDVVFLDPPRSGASEDFLQALVQLAPQRVVYISCNPHTQVRDCQALVDAGYAIQNVQPVDMFPHTNHIECVVALEREA